MRNNSKNYVNAFAWAILAFSLIFAGCKGDDDPEPEYPYENGAMILNEGGFNAGNASLDFVSFEDMSVTSGVFQAENGRQLGDVGNSFGDLGYLQMGIVMNNSAKIEVVDPITYKSVGAVTGLTSPRYVASYGTDTKIVSDLYSGTLSKVDIHSLSVTGTIQTGRWTEAMIFGANRLWVCMADTNQVYVYNSENDSLIATIEVGWGPNSILYGMDDNIWVLCDGGWNVDVPKLVKLDRSNFSVVESYDFPNVTDNPNTLKMVNFGSVQRYYFLNNNNLYSMEATATSLPAAPLFSGGSRQLYGFEPYISSEIWVCDAVDYVSAGTILRVNSTTGAIIDSAKVGVNPKTIRFHYQ